MSKPKYAKGRRIRTVDQLLRQKRIYWNPIAPVKRHVVDAGWFGAWQLRYAFYQVAYGHCFTVKEVKP